MTPEEIARLIATAGPIEPPQGLHEGDGWRVLFRPLEGGGYEAMVEDASEPWLDLVSVTEIAQRADTTPGTVHQWRRRHADFPAALATLAVGPVWHWPDVETWLAKPRRAGRPRKG